MSNKKRYNLKTCKELDDLGKNNKCIILKAHATWCKPCKILEPFIEELLESVDDDVVIVIIDIDEAVEIKRRYRIRSVPYMANFMNGDIMDVINTVNKDTIRKFIKTTMDKKVKM